MTLVLKTREFAVRSASVGLALAAAWLLIAGFSTPASAGINLSVQVSRCTTTGETCPAPAHVYFDASNSTCSAGECGDGWDELEYDWTFGDPNAGTWAYSGESMNQAEGPVAFHVYEPTAAGNFPVTVTARARNGATASWSGTIYIDSPSSLNTRCVAKDDGSPSFAGCPVCSSENGTTCVKSANFSSTVMNGYASGYRRILFEGGQSFNKDSALYPWPGPGPVVISRYGASRVTVSGDSDMIFNPSGKESDRWTFVDIDWAGPHWRFFTGGSDTWRASNWLFLRNGRTGTSSDYEAISMGANVGEPNGVQKGFAVIGNGQSISGDTIADMGSPCMFMGGSYTIIAGMKFNNCTRLIRDSNGGGSVIGPVIVQHNDFSGRRRHNALELRGLADAAGGADLYQDKTLVSFNKFGIDDPAACYDCRGVVLFAGDVIDGRMYKVRRTLVEKNIFSGTSNKGVLITNSSKDATVRNNLFVGDSVRIESGSWDPQDDQANWSGGTRVYNNSFYRTANDSFPAILLASALRNGTADTCYCENNLFWSASGTTQRACSNQCSGGVNRNNASRNLVDLVLGIVPFAKTPPSPATLADWEINGTVSTLLNVGSASNFVITDFQDRVRPAGWAAIGAMQSNLPVPNNPPPPPSSPVPPDPPFLQ